MTTPPMFITNRGTLKPNNEDYFGVFEPTDLDERELKGCLYIIADGVGGVEKGEEASKHAVNTLLYRYFEDDFTDPISQLERILIDINREIFGFSRQKNFSMATTLVAAVVIGNKLIVANVGDSRLYIVRKGKTKQITFDHTTAGQLLRIGSITEEQAENSKSHQINRSIGGEFEVTIDIFEYELISGDKLFLCTDGFSNYVSNRDLGRFFSQNNNKAILENMVSFALDEGGEDNITVGIIEYQPESEMVTEGENIRPPKPIQTQLPRQSPVIWLLGIVAASFVMIIGYKIIFSDISLSPPVITQAVSALNANDDSLNQYEEIIISPTESENSTQVTPSPNNEIDESTENSPMDVAVTDTPEIPTPTPITPIPTPVSQSTPTIEPIVEPLISCVYTILQNDQGLFDIATRKLLIQYTASEIKCYQNPDGSNISCVYDPSNPDYIAPGWQLIFKDVKKSQCEAHSGFQKP